MILDKKNQMIELLMPLILFFISLAQKAGFVDGQSADKTQLVIMIAVAFTLNNCVAFSLWTLIGDKLSKLLAKDVNARKQKYIFWDDVNSSRGLDAVFINKKTATSVRFRMWHDAFKSE
jgi:hypothetical protein